MADPVKMPIPKNASVLNCSAFERMFEKLVGNNQQIQTLTQLRDTLLPKLMKGEIRVSL